jgi:predicted nuclease of predicted toxin-antitoxin system
MAVNFYMDVHVPRAITEQHRRRSIDVVTAQEDGADQLADEELLARAHELGRVLFTQDIRFKAMAELWQHQAGDFNGLIFGHQLRGTLGQYVSDLELIAQATDPTEWLNAVEVVPL